MNKYRIRRKANDYVVEKLEGNKWIGRTLNPIDTWNWKMGENEGVSKQNEKNVSNSTEEQNKKVPEKYAHELLSEPENFDTLDEAEIEESLRELELLEEEDGD